VLLPLAIIVIFAAIVAGLVVTTSRRSGGQGRLSRETRSRDKAAGHVASTSTELEAAASAEGRARGAEAQGAASAGVPAMRGETGVAEWEPVDEEALGVSRRQFLNRANISMLGIGMLPIFGVSLIAFLYPGKASGFGNKVNIGKLADIIASITAKKTPFYAASARTYVQLYPNDAETLKAADSAYEGRGAEMGLDQGFVALWQRCVHLGCRVPWCQSSQWFECPCHGSKYNKVGEKRDGPAPRGLDRFAVEVSGGDLLVNTGIVIQGPPLGTDTTGQKPEGPACV
jgi:cytochrome b6-f complex iron-sulfur subunit